MHVTLKPTMIETSQHLKNRDIEKVISNFIQSGSSFLLTTNVPTTKVNKTRIKLIAVQGDFKIRGVSDEQ